MQNQAPTKSQESQNQLNHSPDNHVITVIMELSTAIRLIEKGINLDLPSQVWFDLGSGEGLFSQALASLLGPGGIVYAIDRDTRALNRLSGKSEDVHLKKVTLDFVKDALPPEKTDGILMANSFHYVQDKPAFLKKIAQHFKRHTTLLLVEYDTDTANPWVPYPISFHTLQDFCTQMKLPAPVKLHEQPSLFGRANIYAAKVEIQLRMG